MLWRMYSNLSLYVILSQCSADHPIWTLLLRHFLLNHSSFMLDLWNYSLYISHSVTTFSVSSYCWVHSRVLDFPVAQMVKNLPADAGDLGLIPGLGTSPGEGHGNPLQYSCLQKPMDRGAWRALCVHKELDMTERLTLLLVGTLSLSLSIYIYICVCVCVCVCVCIQLWRLFPDQNSSVRNNIYGLRLLLQV